MALRQDRDDDLLDILYAASTEPSAWPEFLARLARSLDAPWAAFLVQSPVAPQFSVTVNFAVPEEVIRSYNDYYGKLDPWRVGMQEHGVTEWAGLGNELCSPARFEDSEFYNDCWKVIRFPAGHQAGIIHATGGIPWVLSLLRDSQQPDFEAEHAEYLRRLFPHLRRSLSLHRKVLELKQSLADAGGAVDALDVGLIGVDTQGRICFANALAEGMLRDGDFLTIRDGRLVTRAPGESAALGSLLKTAFSRAAGRQDLGTLTLNNGSRSLHLAALPMNSFGGVIPIQPRIFLTITDPAASPGSREKLLAAIFGLTPAETRVAMLLLAGFDPRQIAEQARTTPDAVRFQLKMVYRKTGVNKQSQLVRLVSRLPGVL